MKKTLTFLFLVCIVSGCATYKFQKPDASAEQGYLAYYDGKPIAEYTVGENKSLPDLALAKKRFKRRRFSVERHYKQTGEIQSRLRSYLWDPPAMVIGFIGGVLRWPLIAAADYKYHRSPAYKARVDKLEEEKENRETARLNALRQKLDSYIAEDLTQEELSVEDKMLPGNPAPKTRLVRADKKIAKPAADLAKASSVGAKQKVADRPVAVTVPLVQEESALAVAVISAQPVKGYSPLKVKFSGQRSHSKSAKIVSYLWDFGDGDTSTQKNPENTYWSTTFGARNFTVTLTVRDQTGAFSSASCVIEVITR